jgi:hypothetical protein
VTALAYAQLAMRAMQSARDEQELIDWWLHEHDHRRRWGLVPDQSPGLDLFQSFKARRNELKQGETNAA